MENVTHCDSSHAAAAGEGHHCKSDSQLSADAPVFVASSDYYYNYGLISNTGSRKDSSSDGSSNNQPNRRVIALTSEPTHPTCAPNPTVEPSLPLARTLNFTLGRRDCSTRKWREGKGDEGKKRVWIVEHLKAPHSPSPTRAASIDHWRRAKSRLWNHRRRRRKRKKRGGGSGECPTHGHGLDIARRPCDFAGFLRLLAAEASTQSVQLRRPCDFADRLDNFGYAECLSGQTNDMTKFSPEIFEAVHSALCKAGEEGLNMEEISEAINIEVRQYTEIIVDTLEVFQLVIKVNSYGNVRVLDSSYNCKYFLQSRGVQQAYKKMSCCKDSPETHEASRDNFPQRPDINNHSHEPSLHICLWANWFW
ncbi:uncharacterized protein LOC141815125 [Curcuma longa]|uniref:uncharacterized protein LOC141815125 n=1 Tax=Curcuma longa TaxID=136217 RepID=UPI003D9DF7E8